MPTGVQSVSPLSRSSTFFVSLCCFLALTIGWWKGSGESLKGDHTYCTWESLLCHLQTRKESKPHQAGVGHLFRLRCFRVDLRFQSVQEHPSNPNISISNLTDLFVLQQVLGVQTFGYGNLTFSRVFYSSNYVLSLILCFSCLLAAGDENFFICLHTLWISHLALGWWLTTLSLLLCFYNAATGFTFHAP